MSLPELAAGLLDEILESIRLRNDRELREFCPPSAATPLTLDEWDLLFGDFHAAHQAIRANRWEDGLPQTAACLLGSDCSGR